MERESRGAKKKRSTDGGLGRATVKRRRAEAPTVDGREEVARALSSSAAAASHAAWKRHVLLQLLPSTQTLLTHLTSLAPSLSVPHLLQAGDSDDYAQLLRSTLVAAFVPFTGLAIRRHPWSPSPPALLHERISAILLHASTRSISRVAPPRSFGPSASSASSRASLSTVQPLALSPSLAELPSVLSLGYRRVRQDSGSALVDHPTVESFEINCAVTLIQQSRAWLLLLDRVGDEAMVHLLSYCFVFVPLLHASFMQVAGPVLTEVYRIARQRTPSQPPALPQPQPQRKPEAGARLLKRAHSDIGSGELTGMRGSPLKRTKTDFNSLAEDAAGSLRDAPTVPAPPPVLPATAPPSAAAVRPPLPACILGQVIPRSSLFFHYPARIRCGLPTHRQLPHTPHTPIPLPFRSSRASTPLPLSAQTLSIPSPSASAAPTASWLSSSPSNQRALPLPLCFPPPPPPPSPLPHALSLPPRFPLHTPPSLLLRASLRICAASYHTSAVSCATIATCPTSPSSTPTSHSSQPLLSSAPCPSPPSSLSSAPTPPSPPSHAPFSPASSHPPCTAAPTTSPASCRRSPPSCGDAGARS